MKTKLIELPDYNIIVSDEKVEKGWQGLSFKSDIKGYIFNHFYTENEWYKDSKKIIASENPEHNLPNIDYNGFEEKFGVVDVEKMAHKKWQSLQYEAEKKSNNCLLHPAFKYGYQIGFKKAQSLNDKKFSLEDMEESYKKGASYMNSWTEKDGYDEEKSFKNLILSLQQPKVFDIEIEMDSIWVNTNKVKSGEILGYYNHIPKITNNRVKIIKVIS